MLSTKKQKPIVGLDLEAGSAAAAEVRLNGSAEVVRHGVVALEPGAFREGEVADAEALGAGLKELFARHKLPRDVRLGLANQKVAVRVLRLPALDESDELEAAIRFQAQEHIPMPLEQAVLDWRVIGRSEGEGGERHVDVVAVAARRDMLASVMEALSAAGLRPAGIDLSAFGMIRALGWPSAHPADPPEAPAGAAEGGARIVGARLYCNLADTTNLAVAHSGACLFTRVSPFGVEAIAQRLAERRELTLEHSRQWLGHVGLDADLASVDGEEEIVAAAREALEEGAAKLADELRMSLDYYGAQEGAVAVEGVVVCGPGAGIPGLVARLERETGHAFSVGTPPALSHLDPAMAARLTLPFGLALER